MNKLIEHIKNANENNAAFLSGFDTYARKNRLPMSVTFEISQKCNLSCNMCYMTGSNETMRNLGRELTAYEWINLAKQSQQLGTMHITLTGGEPFLRNDFFEIYYELKEMGFLISILTNASLITKDIVKELSKAKPLSVGLSLYGSSAETYDKICHNAKAFMQTMDAIESMENAGINFLVKTLQQDDNTDDIQQIRKWAKERNWRYANFDIITNKRNDACSCDEYTTTDTINMRTIDVDNISEDSFTEAEKQLYQKLCEQRDRRVSNKITDGFLCGAGRSTYWITWYGHMQACCELDEPFEMPLENGVVEAWKGLHNKVKQLGNPEKCISCPFLTLCGACPGIHYTDNHKYNQVSGRICAIAYDRFLKQAERKNQK